MTQMVTGCEDCPFKAYSGHFYYCNAPEAPLDSIKIKYSAGPDVSIGLITPDWCPLRKESIEVTLKK